VIVAESIVLFVSVCVPSFNVTFELSLASASVPVVMSLAFVAVGATAAHEEPPYTFISFDELLKYNAPVTRASPSLSSVGSEVLLPKYLSSKLS
jgi:hypothetical protein